MKMRLLVDFGPTSKRHSIIDLGVVSKLLEVGHEPAQGVESG